MPEAPDPYGSAAYQQRILKESAAAAQARNVLRGNGFYLTNPITGNDKLLETTSSLLRTLGSAAGAPDSRPQSRPSTGSRRSARREYEQRVEQLEAHLAEERRTRLAVEGKLVQLEAVLAAKTQTRRQVME